MHLINFGETGLACYCNVDVFRVGRIFLKGMREDFFFFFKRRENSSATETASQTASFFAHFYFLVELLL